MAQEWKICRKRAAQGKFANFGPCDDCHQIEIFNHVNQVESGVEFNRNVFHLHIIPCLFFAFTWLGAFPLWKAQNPLNFLVFLSLSLSLSLLGTHIFSFCGGVSKTEIDEYLAVRNFLEERKEIQSSPNLPFLHPHPHPHRRRPPCFEFTLLFQIGK